MQQGAERSRLGARRRPTRAEIEPAALALLQRHGATIMATARRFAATPEDAEDAYQRGVEILLTKAPTTAEDELVPWLRTVVKHEAWALRRQRQRAAPVADDGDVPEPPSEAALTHDQAERIDRLRVGAEALKQLKPQEIRALVLRAEGYSYKQIQEVTGWTYTKVNRCLTEGRKAFLERVAGHRGRHASASGSRRSCRSWWTARRPRTTWRRCGRTSARACRVARRCASTAARRQPRRRSCPPPRSRVPAGRPFLDAPARLLEGSPGGRRRRTPPSRWRARRRWPRWPPRRPCSAAARRSPSQQVERHAGPAKRIARAERRAPGTRRQPAQPAPRARPQPRPSTSSQAPQAPTRAERRAREAKRKTPPAQQEFEPAWAAASRSPRRDRGRRSRDRPRRRSRRRDPRGRRRSRRKLRA